MPLGWRHESADLIDFEVLDAVDTLVGPLGDAGSGGDSAAAVVARHAIRHHRRGTGGW